MEEVYEERKVEEWGTQDHSKETDIGEEASAWRHHISHFDIIFSEVDDPRRKSRIGLRWREVEFSEGEEQKSKTY